MKDQSSNDNWRLQEDQPPDSRWTLEASEQRLADQWSLQNTPEDLGQEWQPVEYVKPRRPIMAWLLPAVITLALLAVIAYTVISVLPGILNPGEEPQAVVAPVTTPVAGEEPQVTPLAETPVQPADSAPAPEATPTEAVPPTPTPIPLVAQEFGTVTGTYGVNARTAPNTDAAVIRVLDQGETLFVFENQGEWLELFVSDTPLAEGQPLSGTIGYAASEFIEVSTREVSQQLVNEVLIYVDRAPTPTPEPQPTEPPAASGDLTLPTVTPTLEGALEPSAALTETTTVTETEDAAETTSPSTTVTINAVNGVNVRREPVTEEGNVIRLLEFGVVLPAVARNEAGDWIQVLLPDGVTGWIAAAFVDVSGDITSLPLPGEGTAPAAPEIESGEVITSGLEPPAPYTNVVPGDNVPAIIVTVPEGVNARSAPDVDADAVILVPQGAVLPAEARSPDSQWVQVELPTGELAWIFRDTVTATAAVGALPAVEVETPTPTPEPAATAAPIVATPEPETSAPVATAEVRQLMITVYETPSTTSDSVGRAPRGTALDVTGRSADSDWIQVVGTDGTLGWVAASGVEVSVAVSTLPVVD